MFFYGALYFKPSIIIFADFSDSCISLSASSTDTPGSIFSLLDDQSTLKVSYFELVFYSLTKSNTNTLISKPFFISKTKRN